MNLSANTIFHFTKTRKNLLSILKNGFYPRMCLENNYLYSSPYEQWAIPMVCFCDIPLGNIQHHIKTYGKYAIGLSKDWAKRKGITPVLYSNDESLAIDSLRKQLFHCHTNLKCSRYSDEGILDALMYFSCYIKQYEAQVIRGSKIRTIRCYDEREWRYVPSLLINESHRYILKKEEFENKYQRNECDIDLQENPLHYSVNDINYIIVESESEVLGIKRLIENIKGSRYSKEEIDILTTKILSAERISEDF